MPLDNDEYVEILQYLRRLLRDGGLGSVDERLALNLQASDGPYYDLVFYVKHLIEEISLGSDRQLTAVLRRFRNVVETDSGRPVEGIRVSLTSDEARRYGTETIEFSPDSKLQEIVDELSQLLDELHRDRNRRSDNETNE